jgi:hypothetical protein
MPLAEVVQVTFGNEGEGRAVRVHHLLFNSWAMRTLERTLDMSVGKIGIMLLTGRAGITEQMALIHAGLEGFRWRYKPEHHKEPFTLDEVYVLIDDTMNMDDLRNNRDHPVNKAVEKAWLSTFPEKNRIAEEGGAATRPPEASTTSQTGTTSSTPPPS